MELAKNLVVKEISSGSAAENAGLIVGDEVLRYNGNEINGSLRVFKALLTHTDENDVVKIVICRGEESLTFDIKGGKLGAIFAEREIAQEGNADGPIQNSTQSAPITAPSITNVNIVDLHIPFGSMVVFMIKWAIAAIPATLILMAIYFLVASIFLGGCAAVLR